MAVFCTQCGSGLPNSARFCSYCGSSVQIPPPFPGRPLVRPIYGRQVAGVCLGLAQANGWDVAVIRIIAVIGVFFSSGLIAVAYLAGWLGIPEEIPAPYPQNGNPPPNATVNTTYVETPGSTPQAPPSISL
jgi:phage shock protein C